MIWSTPMWNLFHTMCEKCDDDTEKLRKLYELIEYFSHIIPCGLCKQHASNYLHKNKTDSVTLSKNNFKIFFYNFHNSVKKTRKLKLESIDVLDKYKTMNLNEVYLDTIKILLILRLKDTQTVKINKLFIEIFGSAHTKGIDEINEEYVKDDNNKREIFKKIGVNRKQTNKKYIDKLPVKPIEMKKGIFRSSKSRLIKNKQIKNKQSKKSLFLAGGGLLLSILNKNIK